MKEEAVIIEETKKWVSDVVIGLNFCPFAAKEMKQNTIRYTVVVNANLEQSLRALILECQNLEADGSIATTLIIIPESFEKFDDYLNLIELSEKLLKKEGFEGTYQVAGFHPLYQFNGTPADDAANYTNRSPYPMLHILREAMISAVLDRYPNPEKIPENNIALAREKGEVFMKTLLNNCLKSI